MEIINYLRVLAVLFTSFGPHIIKGNHRCNYPKEIFGVQLESWKNVVKWNSLDVSAPISGQSIIQKLDLPRRQKLEYIGRRMRAYFLAPESGDYIFYITCDDKCKLNLSTDEKLANLVTLVTITRYTRYRAWTRKHSAIVRLSEGRSYLLEAILFQRRGDYHLTVGVELPDRNFKAPLGGELLVKYAPAGLYGVAPEGGWGAWSQCSTTCGEGTQTRNRSCLHPPPVFLAPNTTNMDSEMRVCYPIKPCSLPRKIIEVHNTSSTSLLVEWQDRWSHELRQFQIIYNRTSNETAQSIKVNASQKSVELRGLDVFTLYCVRVLLVNRQGIEQMSPCVYARTDQDVPCSPPAMLVARNYSSPFGIKVAWNALPESCWQGIPRGFSIRLHVKETAHEDDKETEEFFVLSNSTDALLENLKTRTTYSLQVAAMTERGKGPYSAAIYVETCPCQSRIYVNWMHAPPLCVKSDNNTPTGQIPDLLHDVLHHVCGTCHGHTTEIIFRERSSADNMIGALNEPNQLNVPTSLKPKMPQMGEGWVFLPVVEVAGFAFLTRKPSGDEYARYLASSVMVRWPAFVMMVLMYFTFGLAVWTVEKYKNPAHFPPRFTRGWKEGVWWALITMATIGYGDRYPKSVPGRILAIVCLLVGVVMTALFLSALTSSLTVFVFDMAANPDRGKKIGVISGSVEQRLGMRNIGSKDSFYDTRDALLEGLKSGAVDGAIKDVFTMDALIKDLNDSVFEVSKTVSKPFSYGIELTGEATNLLKDFKEYLKQKPFSAFKGSSSSTEETPTVADYEESIGFFEPGNFLYQKTVKVTGIALVVFTTGGLIYHVIQTKLKKKQGQPDINDPLLTPVEVKAEMRQLVEEFHIRMQRTYCALKIKHRRELLKNQREKNTDRLCCTDSQ